MGKERAKKCQLFIKGILRDFPGGPMVKDLTSSVGDTGLIPDRRTKIIHAQGMGLPNPPKK